MKILVVDDDHNNRAAAQAQLTDHDVTVVGTYEEAQAFLGAEKPYQCQVSGKHPFEVVLIDLMLPAGAQMQGAASMEFVGEQMPIGLFLMLLAARHGAKRVAVFTDSNHHAHPASACIDAFNPGGSSEPTTFVVEGAKVMLTNYTGWVKRFRPENLAAEMSYDEWNIQGKPSVRAKHWRKLFDYLMAA